MENTKTVHIPILLKGDQLVRSAQLFEFLGILNQCESTQMNIWSVWCFEKPFLIWKMVPMVVSWEE